MRRLSHQGFTLVELMIVVVVVGIVMSGAWTLIQLGGDLHTRELRRADSERTRNNLELGLGRDLGRAVRGGFSAANVGMVRVGTADLALGANDTLLLLQAENSAIPVASRPCRTNPAGVCVALRGDRTADLSTGMLLAVGSARTGYRILQVTAEDGAYRAACGADCPAAAFCPTTRAGGAAWIRVAFGTETPSGSAPSACAESFYPDGRRCQETRVSTTTGTRAFSSCAAAAQPAFFTDATTTDRTTTLGFANVAEWTGIAGGGSPGPAAIPVRALRYFTQTEGTERALVRQRWTTAGTWGNVERIAGPVAAFQVESLHEATAAWTRGDGVADATLSAATNRISSTAPSAGAAGINYIRGYHTLLGLRITAQAVGTTATGARILSQIQIEQSTVPVTAGGAREAP